MRALVVYESIFGNTRLVAERIRDALAETWDADLCAVDDAIGADLGPYGLVVVGGPTHDADMSTAQSRAAIRGGDLGSAGSGVREWLAQAGTAYAGRVAVFDTRTGRMPWTGAASRAMARRLRQSGNRPVGRHSFGLVSKRGPLRDDELYRAWVWGCELAVGTRQATRPRAAGLH